MFVMTAKVDKKKIAIVVAAIVVVIAALVLLLIGGESAPTSAPTNVVNNDDRVAKLIREKQYGHMVGMRDGKIVAVPLAEAASQTKFLPVDHPLIQAARDAGTVFGD